MPEPTLNAPNIGNYRVGKGIVEFKPEGSPDWVHLGNVPELEVTPEIEELEHFSSMEGIRVKDYVIVLEKSMTIRIVMEEWTAQNLALVLLGPIDVLAPGGPTIRIFASNAVLGELRFTSTNEIGPKWNFHWYNVSFLPASAINPISDEWGQLEANGEVLVAGSSHEHAGEFGIAQLTNLSAVS